MKSLRVALAMFTIAPVPRSWHEDAVTHARGTLRWLPFLGAALGALAGLAATAVVARSGGAALLGATISVGLLAWLTRGLHLDGLADTADGLGSRAPAERALAIMRQSDIGPFGVVTVVVFVLIDVVALATVTGSDCWRATAALAVAAATGRLAVLVGAARGVPSARTDGFGALVAGTANPVVVLVLTAIVLGGGAATASAVGAAPLGWAASQAAALLLAGGLRVKCVLRFGGVTGDVFGALIEVTTAAALVGFALS